MRLELHVTSPEGNERLIHKAGAISTLQREARKFNQHHPENLKLIFTAYQIVDDEGTKRAVLVGTPRNTHSLSWSAPDVKTEATVVSVKDSTNETRVRVTGQEGRARRVIRDRD